MTAGAQFLYDGPPAARIAVVDVAGVTLLADLSGALFWEAQSLLVVSDLHLEKGSSFATRGVLLPPYDTAATLGRLAEVIALLERVASRTASVAYAERSPGDVRRTKADTSRIHGDLGWEPAVSIEDGLRAQWEYQAAAASRIAAS